MPADNSEMEVLAARLAVGRVDRAEIYSFADQASTQGNDHPDLLEIMIEGPNAPKEVIGPILARYLLTFGVALPRSEDAQIDLAYRYAKQAVEGHLSSVDAACKIYLDCVMPNGDDSSQSKLKDFDWISAEFGSAEWEKDRPAIEARCEREAHDLCAELVRDFEAGNLTKWQ
jgi:hypothetical protein